MKKGCFFQIIPAFLFQSDNPHGKTVSFAFPCFQLLYMILMYEFIIFRCVDTGTVPWLHAQEWGFCRVRGPECDCFKARESHLNTVSRILIDNGYFP